MKTCRFLVLCLMASACIPAGGVSPAHAVIANPDPQLTGSVPSSPFRVRQTPERSTTEPATSAAASSGKKKIWPWVLVGVAAAVLVVVLVSGGSSSTGGGY